MNSHRFLSIIAVYLPCADLGVDYFHECMVELERITEEAMQLNERRRVRRSEKMFRTGARNHREEREDRLKRQDRDRVETEGGETQKRETRGEQSREEGDREKRRSREGE